MHLSTDIAVLKMSRQDDIAEPFALKHITVLYIRFILDVIIDDVNVSRIDIKYDIKQLKSNLLNVRINVTSVY